MAERGRVVVRDSGDASAQGPGSLVNSGVINGPVHLAARTAAVSGYLLQVQEAIAAADFRGRAEELAELAGFCTESDDPERAAYWRWLAPAWAGKSALMAQFVLHPPAGIDIVAFFITSRQARQNDAAAFCEIVQRQLYALLHEEEPLVTPATRDEQLRLALSRTARRSAERGRRLVLVVDGLDEDRGVTPGPDCHSIAALLPRVPPYGMRIVVAGRPHPPVPGDVPSDHPLRTTRVNHWLEPSPHAQVARWDAEQDLVRLLDEPGPGRDLVGLTVAAGGGLSAADLAHLTGSSSRRVERELHAVTGRSFRHHTGHGDADRPRVYLLAHEEIRRSAEGLITSAELTDYRTRIHHWATAYRTAGWPADTPEYLLRGYIQQLRELRDTARLTALARDPARHERLWRVTGTDYEALSEISAAFELLLADENGDPDISQALGLAWARDQLYDRTKSLPHELIGLWARLGHIDRAVNLARSRRDEYDRVSALAAVARVLVATGQPERAAELADVAETIDHRDLFLQSMAEGLTEAGEHSEAVRTARQIVAEPQKARTLVGIVESLAAAGAADDAAIHADEACEALAAESGLSTQGGMFGALAAALSLVGKDEKAGELAERAAAFAAGCPLEYQAQHLALAARRMARAPGLVGLSARYAAHSATLADALDDPEGVSWLLSEVAGALTATGQHDRAMRLIDRLRTDSVSWEEAVCACAIATAEAGDWEKALRLAEPIEGLVDKTRVLNAVGAALAKSGDPVRAEEQARRSLDFIGEVLDPRWRVKLQADMADFLYRAGYPDQAHAVATLAMDDAWENGVSLRRTSTLAELAGTASGLGHTAAAHRLVHGAQDVARSSPYAYGRLIDFTRVATALYRTGRHDEGEELLSRLAVTARQELDRFTVASALEHIAGVFGTAGHPERAGELAREILELARTADSPFRRSEDSLAAAGAFLSAKDVGSAMELCASLTEDDLAEFLSSVVQTLVETGDLGRAVRIADEIDVRSERERSRGYIAAGEAARGDLARALVLLNEISHPFIRATAMSATVEGMVTAGALDEARALCETIDVPEQRFTALGAVARSLGPTPQGRLTLVTALTLGPWDALIPGIAAVAPDQLPLLADLLLD
ncbi:hypothetical protein GCM10010387_36850 [Streptomyces inusitatus]|uniref:NACHT domain-containing protein n=1 Tax=Streptomyces inusitatus TaxID=68221 RepID=A0A918Q9W7_9ACTN|nr:hypothetical protein [Streptomyces inusitatus]GGZ39342.1 hypothetical protein GCM10010387_36850 [Streptomyces inusitatus]